MKKKIDKGLEALGFEITARSMTISGYEYAGGKIETKRGTFEVLIGENGTARFVKPNGTIKWVYGKSPAQIFRIVRQVIEANN